MLTFDEMQRVGFGGVGKLPRFGIMLRPLLEICLARKTSLPKWEDNRWEPSDAC